MRAPSLLQGTQLPHMVAVGDRGGVEATERAEAPQNDERPEVPRKTPAHSILQAPASRSHLPYGTHSIPTHSPGGLGPLAGVARG